MNTDPIVELEAQMSSEHKGEVGHKAYLRAQTFHLGIPILNKDTPLVPSPASVTATWLATFSKPPMVSLR